MAEEAALLPGTLDVLILKAVSLAPEHGYGVLLRIEQITGGAALGEHGAVWRCRGRFVRKECEPWPGRHCGHWSRACSGGSASRRTWLPRSNSTSRPRGWSTSGQGS